MGKKWFNGWLSGLLKTKQKLKLDEEGRGLSSFLLLVSLNSLTFERMGSLHKKTGFCSLKNVSSLTQMIPTGKLLQCTIFFLSFCCFLYNSCSKNLPEKTTNMQKTHKKKHIEAWRTSSHCSTPPQVVKVLAKNKYCYRPSTTAFFFFFNRKLCKQIFYHHPIRNPFSFDTLYVFKLTMWFFFPLTLVVAANSFCLTRPQAEVALSLVLCELCIS